MSRIRRRDVIAGGAAVMASFAFPRRLFAGTPGQPAAPRPPAVFLATYSHIDPSWQWPLQEGLQQADAVFRSALDRLSEFPDLRFSETAGAFYRWIRETDPSTFARLQRAVAAGRFEPLGGWWVEADTNIPTGESLMRQAFYGQREFDEAFGRRTTVAMLPDSFGSSANLPAILKAQGYRTYVFSRGAFADGSVPPAESFDWHGFGASSIVAYRNPVAAGVDDGIATVKAAVALGSAIPPLVWFGLGDHGGAPSRAALSALQAYLRRSGSPVVAFTRFEDYFANQSMPVAKRSGEMQSVFAGGYANAARLQMENLRAERALLEAEASEVMASALLGLAGSPSDLDDAWQSVLLAQHHDTITGANVRESGERHIAANFAAAEAGADATVRHQERVVNAIDHTMPGDAMIAVFNPLDRNVTVPVSYGFSLAGNQEYDGDAAVSAANQLVDDSGDDIAYQIVRESDGAFPDTSAPIVFMAKLPALGYRTYRLRHVNRHPAAMPPGGASEMQNQQLRVRLDQITGQPAELVTAVPISLNELRRPMRLVVFADAEETLADRLPVSAASEAGTFRLDDVRVVENGPVRMVVRNTLSFRDSRVVQDWILYAGEKVLRCRLAVTWREPRVRLALAIHPAWPYRSATYDVPFGRVTRGLADEVRVAQSYVAVSSGQRGLALLGLGRHAPWAGADTIGCTLLRSSAYGAFEHEPASLTPDQAQDIGDHTIDVAVVVGPTSSEGLGTARETLGRTFSARWVGVHAGTLPGNRGLLETDSGVRVASIRRVEHGGVIVRINDESGKAHRTSVSLAGKQWAGPIDAYGIVAVRFDSREPRAVDEI